MVAIPVVFILANLTPSAQPPVLSQLFPVCPPDIHFPLSLLRFQFEYGGNLNDKEVPAFVDDCFEQELLKQAKSKATQGLIFQVIQHCAIDPGSFRRFTSFRALVTGRSVTHNRSVYLSDEYRKGTLLALNDISKELSASFIQSIIKDDTSVAKDPRLKTCLWCTTDYLSPQVTTSGPFGDRRYYYFFFCVNANIARFRFTATSFIETKLR